MATPPVSISVRLTDVNDNVPRFQPSPSLRPVFLPAGDSKRIVTQVRAEDRDWTDNGRLEYSLLDVSPAAGRNKFVMNAQTGVIDAVRNNIKFNYETGLNLCFVFHFISGWWIETRGKVPADGESNR